MSKKKTVKAPLTYDPGKGRPKEHLAYLNWQEMEALKSLNGKNVERGPKGIPSYAAFAGTTGTGYASAARSTPASSKTSGSSSISRISGGTAGSNAARSYSSPSSSVSRISGGVAGSNTARASAASRTTTTSRTSGVQTSAPRSISGIGSPSRGVTASYSRGVTTPSAQRTASGVGSPIDRAVKQAVESRSISSAQKTPALRQDKAKASGGYKLSDITGTNVPGGKVTGAIQSVKQAKPKVTTPVVVMSGYAQPTGYNTTFNAQNSVNALRDIMQSQVGFGDSPFTSDMDKTMRHLSGEVGTSGVGAGQVAQTMINRSLVNNYARQLGLPTYNNDLSSKKQWASTGNQAYKAAKPGSEVTARVADRAISELMSGVPAPYATDFRAVKQKGGVKTKKTGVDVAGNRFGNFEGVSEDQVKDLRSSLGSTMPFEGLSNRFQAQSTADVARSAAYMTNPTDRPYDVRTSPSVDKIRSIVPTGDTAGRTTVPGLISYPDLNRPVPPSVGRSAVVPTVRPRKEITDRILPEPPGRKLYYDRISPEGGAPPVGIGAGDIGASAGVGLSASGSITVPSRSIGVLGGVNGNAGYSQDLARNVYVGSVAPTKFRGATDIASSFPPGVSEPTPTRMRSAIETAPNKSYSQIPSPVSTGMLPAKPPTPFRSATAAASALPVYAAPPAPTYSQIPSPTSLGVLTSQGIIQSGIGAIKSFDKAAFDTLNNAASYVKQYSDAQKGLAGGINKLSGAFNKGVSASDQAVIDATQSALKTGARKIASLQQSWNNAVGEAKRVNPAIKENESEDISRGLKTVTEADGYKLGEGKTLPSTSVPPPEFKSPTTVPPPAPSYSEDESEEQYDGLSMMGGLGMVPYNKPGSKLMGISMEQPIDKRERILQRYYDGKLKMTTSQEGVVDDYLERADKAIEIGQALTGVPIGAAGLTSKAYRKSVKEKINAYIDATPEQKIAMEKSNPEIIRWAAIVGEKTESPYSDYVDWATSRGLRGPTEISRDGGVYGIPQSGEYGIVEGPSSDVPTKPQPTSGGRPDVYYQWDLGVNIPSPSDPNYTQYQTYLIDRAASQRAMGWA